MATTTTNGRHAVLARGEIIPPAPVVRPRDWLTPGHPLSAALLAEYQRRLGESVRDGRRYSTAYFLEELGDGLYAALLAHGVPDEFTPAGERGAR